MDVERLRRKREIFFTEAVIEGSGSADKGVTDVGLDGVFIDTINPLPVGTILRLRFGLGRQQFLTTQGIVVQSMPSVGMGIQFARTQA